MTPSATKPLGLKSYGSIGHLPDSRLGPGDHKLNPAQAALLTTKARDRHDCITVTEKLDGTNVGVLRLNGTLIPLGRSGYPAASSRYEQHVRFHNWTWRNYDRFMAVLREGERLCGEWLLQAHATRYQLPHEPFVVFDLMVGTTRTPYEEFTERIAVGEFVRPYLIHRGGPFSISDVMTRLNTYGFHGALDPVEGAVWRMERNRPVRPGSKERRWVVDFLAKYVRPDKVDGTYMKSDPPLWNVDIANYP